VHHLFNSGETLDKNVLSVRIDGGLGVLREGEDARAQVVPAATLPAPSAAGTLAQMEEALMRQAIAQAKGNVSAAARLLGISRPQLAYRMKKLALA
jgi:two-component system response regulator HydG